MDTITLDDVAKLSGVSRSTASRVINDQPGVRPDVRERVQRIADHLGFRPNRAAKNLASGRASVIGLVIPSEELRVDPYGASITHAVGRAATRHDLGLMLHLAEEVPGRTVHHILRDGLIDGLVISSVALGRPWVDELLDSSLPTVLIGRHPRRTDLASVDVENVDSSASATAHLFDQGCERVGTITGPLGRVDARQRLDGFRLAHERAGRVVDETLVVEGDFRRGSAVEAARLLIGRGVDGIVAGNDEMAIGAMWACTALGVSIPGDVAIVGFDGTGSGLDTHGDVTLSSVVQPFDRLADTAVSMLNAIVEGHQATGPVSIPPDLVVGGSSLRRT
ncbi:MAG: LacI family DNA-binding transcriptional regulator [Actinobacteria bacterium]|nr:LacI family DNA-binding transcriptional regulator [Actinomycetota bacterium]